MLCDCGLNLEWKEVVFILLILTLLYHFLYDNECIKDYILNSWYYMYSWDTCMNVDSIF